LKRIGKNFNDNFQEFMDQGEDFVVRRTLRELAEGMNALVGNDAVDYSTVEQAIRDREAASNDPQLEMIRHARTILSERLIRVAKPAPMLDPTNGPLIAVRLSVLTRKSLGGLETDLDARVLGANGQPIPGLYSAGEVAGFGGGGMHGYRALEGTFLGGCIFSGRVAGRAAARSV
jgi:predicted oxidoreductase